MEISSRAFFTALHGFLFGGFFLLAVFGLVVELIRSANSRQPVELTDRGYQLAAIYLGIAASLGWGAVLLGVYVVYPWYRAVPPAGTSNLAAYPQRLLLSSPATSGWHSLGMEWKEHVAWLAPIAITTVVFILWKHRPALKAYPQIRASILVFALVALASAGIASFFGAMINKHAPVDGGSEIHLLNEP